MNLRMAKKTRDIARPQQTSEGGRAYFRRSTLRTGVRLTGCDLARRLICGCEDENFEELDPSEVGTAYGGGEGGVLPHPQRPGGLRHGRREGSGRLAEGSGLEENQPFVSIEHCSKH